jgi:hypothetical protein
MTKNELNQRVDAFINKYINQTKGYPTDNDYRGECLSIVKIYMKELWGFNPPSSGVNAAYGYWTNFPAPLGTYFTKYPNAKVADVPEKGDVVIWKSALAGSDGRGHIAIATGKGDTNSFEVFGQNWGGKHGHHTTHNYLNVYGWLKPKLNELEKDAIQFEGNERVYFWAQNPDVAASWYGPEWGKYVRIIRPQVIIQKEQIEVIKEIIKEVEKVVEVKIPVEIIKTIIEEKLIEKELTEEDKKNITIEYIKNIINKIVKILKGE